VPSTIETARISRMIPLETARAPTAKCSNRVSTPPRTSSSNSAATAAVVTIFRPGPLASGAVLLPSTAVSHSRIW
jgi:hypothetical protein